MLEPPQGSHKSAVSGTAISQPAAMTLARSSEVACSVSLFFFLYFFLIIMLFIIFPHTP